MSKHKGRPKKPCKYFNTTKGCYHGDKCTYSHDLGQSTPAPSPQPFEADEIDKWKRSVPRNRAGVGCETLGVAHLAQFFEKALELVKQSSTNAQSVVSLLSTEGGLSRVSEVCTIIDANAPSTFERHLLPFLQLICEDNVRDSFVLEMPLATIYNFLYGPNGRRASAVYSYAVSEFPAYRSKATPADAAAALNVVAITFANVVELNSNSVVNEDLKSVCRALVGFLDFLGSEQTFALHPAMTALEKTTKRFAIAAEFPHLSSSTKTASKANVLPTFKLVRDGPGSLSADGRRHDNDSSSIGRIKIMPTASELASSRAEYLPVLDLSQSHLVGISALLDRQFRLLREDTVGQLRDAAKGVFDKDADKSKAARTLIYKNATLVDLHFDKFRGLDLVYKFDQPKEVQSMTKNKRMEWWQSTKRLQKGALVCLLGPQTTPLFCSVHETGLEREEISARGLGKPKELDRTLFNDAGKAYLTVTLVDTTEDSVRCIFNELKNGNDRGCESLVEFPGILVPSFKPTLEALQRMIKRPDDVPFAALIASSTNEQVTVQPPVYARRPGFRFDLRCLASDGQGGDLWLSPLADYGPAQEQSLLDRTTLDAGQARSLQQALSQELALIQGPPGTGKTYLGVSIIQALLANRDAVNLGPILCVCYTNHALDQLLEHLLDKGIEQVIRVGSRSKAEKLQKLTLAYVGQQIERSGMEKSLHYKYWKELDECTARLKDLFRQFKAVKSLASVREHLQVYEYHHYKSLFQGEVDADGFTRADYGRGNVIDNWLSTRGMQKELKHRNAGEVRPIEELRLAPLWEMNQQERRALHYHWTTQIRQRIRGQIEAEVADYLEAKEHFELIRKETDLRCLKQAHVIGVTTSGLARVVNLLERVNAKVLVCEEAGEVLEAHMLSTFLPSIEHAIFIGDHQQLRPQVQNYDLTMESPRGKQYSFDLSLFERLIDGAALNGPVLPYSTLELQRRMHPSISELLRITSYPELCDDASVGEYPQVVGMRKRLFWLDHSHAEAGASKDVIMATSHSNDYEVEMTAALVTHLVSQGVYTSQDIAVLTPYLGQLRKLKYRLANSFVINVNDRDQAELNNDGEEEHEESAPTAVNVQLLKGIRLATVDNFQGEEAKVVIISLVRCNSEKKCGFLRTPNRVNVLLSRAKHGMYIVGNKATYEHVSMWDQVITNLQQDDNFGTEIELACPRHPDVGIVVENPDDFSVHSPEGGCSLKCANRLKCGHACYQKCHSEMLHDAVKCLEPCQRTMKGCDDHSCPRLCGDDCPPRCSVPVPNVALPCGHVMTLPCWESKKPADAKCQETIVHTSSGCGHNIIVKCFQSKDPSAIECSAVCKETLQCGHVCKRACKDCRSVKQKTGEEVIDHGTCSQICERPSKLCRHSCQKPCHSGTKCSLCTATCEVRCAHSACTKKCSEPCTPCAEEHCASQCPHQRCEMPCAVPCNWKPCSLRCELKLECGHQCPSLCGEACPSCAYCQECANGDILATPVDFIMGATYAEINLDEDPCIFLLCGHFFTRSTLDGTVGMSEHYRMNEDGSIESIKQSLEPFDSKDLKTCPQCRGTLRNICRYGRIVKRALLDESTKRFRTWARKEFAELAIQALQSEDNLSHLKPEKPYLGKLQLRGSREDQFKAIKGMNALHSIAKKSFSIQGKIEKFLKKVRGEEQPYRQVWTMVEDIRRRKGILAHDMPGELGPVMIEMRHQTFALACLLKHDMALLSAAINVKKDGLAKVARNDAKDQDDFIVDFTANRFDCLHLIDMARESKYPKQEAEGHLLCAQYCCLERSVANISEGSHFRHMWEDETGTIGMSPRTPTAADLKEQAARHLDEAEAICENYPGSTAGLMEEIESTAKMLRDTFFEPITSEERLQVLAAMKTELSTSGLWYACVNGHPFTVGECGGPMQESVCPECGAPVGGREHLAAQGVQADEELNRLMRGVVVG